MAEFLLKDIVRKRGLAHEFEIASAATSREEIGNPVHYGTKHKLAQLGISVAGKTARQPLVIIVIMIYCLLWTITIYAICGVC